MYHLWKRIYPESPGESLVPPNHYNLFYVSRHGVCGRGITALLEAWWVCAKTYGSLADAECERLFIIGHQRLSDGHCDLSLPRKTAISPREIGNTLAIAQQALISTQQWIVRDPCYQEEDAFFMGHYEGLGHMYPKEARLLHCTPWHLGERRSKLSCLMRLASATADACWMKCSSRVQLYKLVWSPSCFAGVNIG